VFSPNCAAVNFLRSPVLNASVKKPQKSAKALDHQGNKFVLNNGPAGVEIPRLRVISGQVLFHYTAMLLTGNTVLFAGDEHGGIDSKIK
jgi:hypothetical protein